jgi:UDP-N-acetylglucosamine--N-acetylmuramyl-(pentapeptide) pyrophosphoryl-undecaprenol N-acetylglucosamine transferase
MDGKRAEGIGFFDLDKDKKTILFVGGSQGARSVNQSLSKQLEAILEEDVQIIWQCGKAFYPLAQEARASLEGAKAGRLKVYDFISRMDLAYSVADIVVSRAGAIAISELCIAGNPLILVPLPSAAEDHQTKNALALTEKNAAILVRDDALDKELSGTLIALLNDEEKQASMRKNILKFARPEATEKIVDEVIKLLEG